MTELTEHRLFVGTFPDGSQLLITQWLDGDGAVHHTTAATRPTTDTWVVWSPPITLDPE